MDHYSASFHSITEELNLIEERFQERRPIECYRSYQWCRIEYSTYSILSHVGTCRAKFVSTYIDCFLRNVDISNSGI